MKKPEQPLDPQIDARDAALEQAREARRARTRIAGDIAGLPARTLERVVEASATADGALGKLVKARAVKTAEARELRVAEGLLRLLDQQADLARVVKQEEEVADPRELAGFDEARWQKIITRARVKTPDGTTPAEYARVLTEKVAAQYPTDAFLARVLPADAKALRSDLQRNPARYANRFPGLGLEAIAADESLAKTTRVKRLEEQIGYVAKVRELNPDRELLALDYSPDSADVAALKLTGVPQPARPQVLKVLKGYQRAHGLAGDAISAARILDAGYHDAATIVRDGLDTFTTKSGLAAEAARRVYHNAEATAGAVTAMVGTVLDWQLNGALALAVDNTVAPKRGRKPRPPKGQTTIADYLKKFDGYTALFGSQNYCKCDHCQSILGPAAYLVDLMSFVELKVLDKVFTGLKQNHVLHLKSRRPDLWTLDLSCRNTDETIPTLEIINEILENYIATRGGYTGALTDRAAIRDIVYRTKISRAAKSFRQPFVRPLEVLEIYLEHFERPRVAVARTLEAAPDVVARAALRMPLREYELVTDPATAPATLLRDLYGISFTVAGNGIVQALDAQLLLEPMGVTRAELGDLIGTRYVTNNGGANPRIIGEKSSTDGVQNDIERIHGLTVPVLDRLHRITRLWRRTQWSIAELDLVLSQLSAANLGSGITAATLGRSAEIMSVQTRFALRPEHACALWSDLPRWAVAANTLPLFDRLFNTPPFALPADALPQANTRFVHPALRDPAGAATDAGLSRLLAGLHVDDQELLQLITGLASALGANLTATSESARGFALTVPNLTLLYRHARLAELLDISVPDLFQAATLAGITGGCVQTLDQLSQLLEFHDWRATTAYSLDDLGVITGTSVQRPDAYADPTAVAAQVVADVTAERSLEFAASVLAFEGISEAQSERILLENAAVIEALPAGRGYRLRPAFVPALATMLTIPADMAPTAADRRALSDRAKTVLLRHHASAILPARLALRLGLPADRVAALLAMAGTDLGGSALVLALQGTGPTDALVTLTRQVLALSVLFRHRLFDRQALEFVDASRGIFGITDFTGLTVEHARRLSVYVARADTSADEPFTADPLALTLADVQAALRGFNTTQRKFVGVNAELARILRTEPGAVAALQAAVPLAPAAVGSLRRLHAVHTLSEELGIGAATLEAIVSDDYQDLSRAGDAVIAAFRARFPDERVFRERAEPFEDRLRSCTRDGLTDYLLHSAFPHFTSRSDLYRHFLVDVELEGCARTSRVVAAISSVQLYVHRCLMNLEQDSLDPPRVRVPPESIPRQEWEWRRNYRVWEANRKVFLYPENYIEPGLRDDKSELFQELEDTLLQQEVREQHVLDAFGTYLTGLEGMSNLSVAGSYLERTTAGDRLHLFGVSADDPPTYYRRTVDLLENERPLFGHWTKMDVQIPVRRVSPVMCLGRMYVFWVELNTRSKSEFVDGNSNFWGYVHRLTVAYTMLRLDGTWSAPQKLGIQYADPGLTSAAVDNAVLVADPLDEGSAERLRFVINVPGIPAIEIPTPATRIPRYDFMQHAEALDGYTLRGAAWDMVYPSVKDGRLYLSLRNFRLAGEVDLGRNQFRALAPNADIPSDAQALALHVERVGNAGLADLVEFRVPPAGTAPLTTTAGRSLLIMPLRALEVALITDRGSPGMEFTLLTYNPGSLSFYTGDADEQEVARLPAGHDVSLVYGPKPDVVVGLGFDYYLVHRLDGGSSYRAHRLSTTVTGQLRVNLALGGIDRLLQTERQKELDETQWGLNAATRLLASGSRNPFTGAYGGYLQEVCFHIPFLIANHLNSQQDFAGAQRWYHYIFDPTSSESTTPPQDRNWRYWPFRGIGMTTLRELLTDEAAIARYRADPFNPHAIARLRLSAYQKCIVMKYVDNLLDWGDSLFAQFTMESVNEAIMLYVMAADILGDRPVELGECGDARISPKSYERIKAMRAEGGSEFLLELETVVNSVRHTAYSAAATGSTTGNGVASTSYAATAAGNGAEMMMLASREPKHRLWSEGKGRLAILTGLSLVEQLGPAFCVPANRELAQYWDRVADRLFKIRHCMDLNGVRRQLALFAPEIDPRLLVRAKAAGLSMEEVLDATSGNLPPYRFSYLIEKARSYAATVQSFGAALTAALEKKDTEELSRLRTIHEQRIQRLTQEIRQQEVKDAEVAIATLERQRAATQFRKDYYAGLKSRGLTEWERTQQVALHTASSIHVLEATYGMLSSAFHLLPDVGSPFAMKYGGTAVGSSLGRIGAGISALADVASAVSMSAGLEAGFQRRDQDWEHQAALADRELQVLEKQIEGATIRKLIAEKSLAIHQTSIEQAEEVFALYGSKFSSFALYTWLSTSLQRLYREAYNGAFAVARLAEQAYRFERGDDTYRLGADYWDPSKAGLLAGDRLLVELQSLERRFIETNYRTLEISQSFSLGQINPAALVTLREQGSCEFAIPEIFFDLSYPGHYRRRIKAVRLSMPCVTGPHTNVGATLTLLESQIRQEPQVGPAYVRTLPPTRTVSIATSSAQNDAGVFEFSFRDERYMPFEGAGAVSAWKLSLPKSFRAFDYETISDVILHVSYTAEEDGGLRAAVEENTATVDGELLKYLKATAVPRLFSLRHEFPTEFHRLLNSPAGTEVSVKLSERHFPLFLQRRNITVESASLALRTPAGQSLGTFKLSINGGERASFPVDEDLGGLRANQNLAAFFGAGKDTELRFEVKQAADLAPAATAGGNLAAISADRLLDVLIYMEYRVTG